MPELPEVETIKNKLSSVILQKPIVTVSVLREKSFRGDSQQLVGLQFIKVGRRAKVLDLQLSADQHLLVHLKMTGQLIYVDEKQHRIGGGHPSADWINQLPSRHTRVIFNFNDRSKLFFNDMRVFGWLWLTNAQEAQAIFDQYGPDINDLTLTAAYLWEKWQRKSIPIKQAIMDNQIVAGVGNIYASEALFLAGISPLRPAKSLNLAETEKLLRAMQQIIAASIAAGGTTFDGHFVDVNGLAGGYQNKLMVYGKDGQPCPACGTLIERTKLGGRGTFFCSHCQH